MKYEICTSATKICTSEVQSLHIRYADFCTSDTAVESLLKTYITRAVLVQSDENVKKP